MRRPIMLADMLAVLHCVLSLHWLPQRPSAATNSEGSHSVRLLIIIIIP